VADGKSIYVASHTGLGGSAIVRQLERRGRTSIIADSHQELDLRVQASVWDFMEQTRPDQVIVVAGTVGGIHANRSRPAEFLFDNAMIHANVIDAAHRVGVEKLLYLGSSCIYPRLSAAYPRERPAHRPA